MSDDDTLTELTGMDVVRLDGVTAPANGTEWLLIKSLPPSTVPRAKSLHAGARPSKRPATLERHIAQVRSSLDRTAERLEKRRAFEKAIVVAVKQAVAPIRSAPTPKYGEPDWDALRGGRSS